MRKLDSIGKINTGKYPEAPTWDEIASFLTEIKMNMYQFERYYGLPFNQLTQIKSGAKKLAPQYWHYIFQKIKPTYGAVLVEEYTINKQKNRTKAYLPIRLPSNSHNPNDNHDRLKRVK